jgi:hypothetical protein
MATLWSPSSSFSESADATRGAEKRAPPRHGKKPDEGGKTGEEKPSVPEPILQGRDGFFHSARFAEGFGEKKKYENDGRQQVVLRPREIGNLQGKPLQARPRPEGEQSGKEENRISQVQTGAVRQENPEEREAHLDHGGQCHEPFKH